MQQALKTLFAKAMESRRCAQSQMASSLLLALWSPNQHRLDLNDLGYLDRPLNVAARHLINFLIGCQIQFRQLATYQDMEAIITTWKQESPQ